MNEDFGLYWHDYGARWYDASIARWNAVDPLADEFTHWTPYNYVGNDPVSFIAPDGLYRTKKKAEKMRKRAIKNGDDVGEVYQSGDEYGFSLGNGSHAFNKKDFGPRGGGV
ncbi:MAG: RHS repeat-associated core domain-containing protein, partial [Bacteroidota bacterium]